MCVRWQTHGCKNEFVSLASVAGVPTLIYLSKIDQYDSDVIGSDIMKTFESKKLARLVKVRVLPQQRGNLTTSNQSF